MTIDELLNEAGITPGPWEIEPLDGKFYGTSIEPVGVDIWCSQKQRLGKPSERELERWRPGEFEICDSHYEDIAEYANARLIAASRKMLKALIEFTLRVDATRGVLDSEETPLAPLPQIPIIESATGLTWGEIKEKLS